MKKYNYAIDFWKIVFCYIIVCLHSNNFSNPDKSWFRGGAICVEFFFIITGFLMNQSVHMSKKTSTLVFVYKKFSKILPYVFLTSLTIFIEKIYINRWGFKYSISQGYKLFFSELTFTRLFGFSKDLWNINGAAWYLSAMLLAIIIIYPLLNVDREKFSKTYFPIITILLIGYLIQTHGTIIVITEYSFFTFDGVNKYNIF
ncbi:hypothetical protein LAD12857_03730 [Lacrimispora amygdalina]|uniref:Acyltransferase 3 domain-containing protein n=1 Tax=Lacrimispora amygdalina TaxID=253257 RepID=A0ABQ5M0H0_9FIRM